MSLVLDSSVTLAWIYAAETTEEISLVFARVIESGAWVPAWGATANLATRHRLTLYDAAYLELARRRCLPLATLDHELRAAATAEDVALLGLR